MYITESHNSKPYQAYVPNHVRPRHGSETIGAFTGIDKLLRQDLDELRFRSELPGVVSSRDRLKSSLERERGDAQVVIEHALCLKHIDEKSLKLLNSLLTSKKNKGYRVGAGFVGGSDPSMSWHVGSPAGSLQSLMSKVLSLQALKLPASYLAIVSLMRLLAIHPFEDGNGRVARLYCCWLVFNLLGPSIQFIKIVDLLWNREAFNLHYAAELIKVKEDWSYLFEYIYSASELTKY